MTRSLTPRSAAFLLENLYGDIAVSLQTPTRETYIHRGDVGLSWDRYIGNIRLLVREHMKRVALRQPVNCTLEVRIMVTENSKLTANIIQSVQDANAIMQEWCEFVSGLEREFGLPAYQRVNEVADISQISEKGKAYSLQQSLKLVFWKGFPFANSRLGSEYSLGTLEKGKFCNHPFIDVGVLCNGDVTLCCLDYDGQLIVGNVGEDTLESILNGERARNLRACPCYPVCLCRHSASSARLKSSRRKSISPALQAASDLILKSAIVKIIASSTYLLC